MTHSETAGAILEVIALLKIENYLLNPDAISHIEIKKGTDEVIIYLLDGRKIDTNKAIFLKIYDAFDSEGLIKDKTKVEPIK